MCGLQAQAVEVKEVNPEAIELGLVIASATRKARENKTIFNPIKCFDDSENSLMWCYLKMCEFSTALPLTPLLSFYC